MNYIIILHCIVKHLPWISIIYPISDSLMVWNQNDPYCPHGRLETTSSQLNPIQIYKNYRIEHRKWKRERQIKWTYRFPCQWGIRRTRKQYAVAAVDWCQASYRLIRTIRENQGRKQRMAPMNKKGRCTLKLSSPLFHSDPLVVGTHSAYKVIYADHSNYNGW